MYTNRERAAVVAQLIEAMLAARWTEEGVAEACAVAMGHWPSWLDALARRVVSLHPGPQDAGPGPSAEIVEAFLIERRAGSEQVSFDWPVALVFGALISATDPIAVVALVKGLGAPPRLALLTVGLGGFVASTAWADSFDRVLSVEWSAKPSEGAHHVVRPLLVMKSFLVSA